MRYSVLLVADEAILNPASFLVFRCLPIIPFSLGVTYRLSHFCLTTFFKIRASVPLTRKTLVIASDFDIILAIIKNSVVFVVPIATINDFLLSTIFTEQVKWFSIMKGIAVFPESIWINRHNLQMSKNIYDK